MYGSKPEQIGLKLFADADWASCTAAIRLTTVSVITAKGPPISWKSTRRTICGAIVYRVKYIALTSTAHENL